MPVRISERAYPHGHGFRFRITEAPGVRTWGDTAATEREARELAEEYARGIQARVDLTVGGLVERYLDWLRAMGRKDLTLSGARGHLLKILGPLLESDAATVSVSRARARYLDLTKVAAAATHQIALGRARALWKWAIRQGFVKSNPWLEVEKLGRMVKGKPQLRIDEARKLANACMESVMVCDGALAIALAQMMALRVSEVVFREVRDVDDNGRLLWIPDAKTPAGRRALQIPSALKAAVKTRCVGQKANAPLIRTSAGVRPSRRWMSHKLERYCERAGVPIICPHALRGQWATIAVDSGALTHMVAEALGHASFDVTAAHYADAGALEQAKQRKRLSVLSGGKERSQAGPRR